MKRAFRFLATIMFGLIVFCSCSKNDNVIQPEKDTPSVSVPDKEFLENTAKEFVGMFTADQAAPYTSIINVIKDSSTENVDDDIDDIIDGLISKTESPNLAVYRYAIKAAAFNGRYVLTNGVWNKENGNGLVADFYDDRGRACRLTVTTSGTTKKVVVYEDSRTRYRYDNNWNYIGTTKENNIYEAELPSHIECVLTQGSSQLVKVVLNLDLSKLTEGQRINLFNNSLSLSCTADFANVAKITTAANYQAWGTSMVNIVVEKNGRQILSAFASAQSTLTGWPEEIVENDLKNVTDAVLNLDILGKIQIQGTCSSIGSLKDALENADDYENQYNEQKVRQYVNQANNFMKANVYYNNIRSEVRASLKFDVDYEERYRWEYRDMANAYFPTSSISFPDGSSYFMANYFTEDAFKSLVDMFNDLTKKVEDQVD